jgi:hypothetical protein
MPPFRVHTTPFSATTVSSSTFVSSSAAVLSIEFSHESYDGGLVFTPTPPEFSR